MDNPTTPLAYQSASPAAMVKGQTGLLVFGIISIILGALSGCSGLMMPMALGVPQPQGAPRMQVGTIIGGALMYLAVAGGFIWVGVGSVRKRRWVRPIVVAFMSPALVGGVFGLIGTGIMAANLPSTMTSAGAPAAPAAVMHTAIAVMIVTAFVLFLGIPAAYLLFYGRKQVREALEFLDPTPRWTDAVPIPALVVSVVLALVGAMLLISIPQGLAMFCGKILTGPAAMAVLAAEAAAALVLARLTAKLRPAGWWGTVALVIFLAAMYISTSLRTDLTELYAKAGYSAEQVKMMGEFNVLSGKASLIFSVPIFLVSLGYLLYVRKFFGKNSGPRIELPSNAPN